LVHLAKHFQRRRFLEIDQSEIALPMVAIFIYRSKQMSNPYGGHSIDASYQVSVHLAKQFQRRRI
jgi:hypothetical protein